MDSTMVEKEKIARRGGLKWAKKKHVLALEILELLNQPASELQCVVRDIVETIKIATGFQAVGVRLRTGDDYPYFVTRGFSDHFVKAENSVCESVASGKVPRDSSGKPLLRCRCGQVLEGRIDPSQSHFSRGGTFWTNNLSRIDNRESQNLHVDVSDSLCRAEGYESVALIPLKCGGEIVGLMQLNDKREDCFSPHSIRFLEAVAASIGLALERISSRSALAKTNEELERRAQERTSELIRINDRLRNQMAERERIEEALHKSETRYRTLVETVREIIWTVDTDGKYTYVSPSVTSVLGYTVEEMMSLDPIATLAASSRDLLVKVFSEGLKGETHRAKPRSLSRTLEAQQRCKDGSLVWMEITATALHRPDGAVDGILGVSREISDRKHIEEIKSEFMTTAAHELQTPLTSIIGYSELLLIRDDFSEEEKKDCLCRVHAQAENLAALVSRLLGIWGETGRIALTHSSPWLVRDTVESIVNSFRKRCSTHRFETVFPEQPVRLTIAEDWLREVLENVLNNAVQYSPDGGLIRLTCEFKHNACQFSIEDEGIGMTPEQVPRVFDRFYRADTSNTAVSGFGLGMSLVKTIVEAEGGKVWVESAYGTGTTVRFSLPIRVADAS